MSEEKKKHKPNEAMQKQRAFIHPLDWGRHAWATLFAAQWNGWWERMISDLPYVLPCASCRHGAFKYLRDNPVGKVNVSEKTDRRWLQNLRWDIEKRENHQATPAYVFQKPGEWLSLDLALIVFCIGMTCTTVHEPHVEDFILVLSKLLDRPLTVSITELPAQPSREEMILWCRQWTRDSLLVDKAFEFIASNIPIHITSQDANAQAILKSMK